MIHRIQMYLPILRLIVSKLHDGCVVMLLIQESMFCVWQGFLLDRECIQWTKIWENMCSRSITMGKYINVPKHIYSTYFRCTFFLFFTLFFIKYDLLVFFTSFKTASFDTNMIDKTALNGHCCALWDFLH